MGVAPIDVFYTDTADINLALTPDDPERSLISLQFPEFHTEADALRRFGLQVVAAATFEYQDHWATGPGYVRGNEYQRLKKDFADQRVARAEKHMPGLRKHIVSLDIATPITMHHPGHGRYWFLVQRHPACGPGLALVSRRRAEDSAFSPLQQSDGCLRRHGLAADGFCTNPVA